ncbi:hydroxyacid dehydrogenase [Planomicrobium sp. Y74]|uniref:NAD(P)-dependent oxidoreductase n=1 Tax=Planomicrobium sp. Y74 TaxID=2478977 RepID=UPI000EF53822|nr:hydroxyacid dehydrogenase [Planomicrobium sp. Y74]RLQ90203.1 hydroxyacid dehydrogenase [Planomicrobium sp. Y74]
MDRLKILQILPMYHPEGEKVLNQLAEVKKFDEFNEQQIIQFLDNNIVDGIILRAPAAITQAILDHCTGVRAISGAGVGLDNIDVNYATEKGIAILNAPSLNSQATAEHTVSLIMAVMKNIPSFNEETKKGNFSYRDGRYTHEMHGKKVGLIGFGNIAQKVGKILSAGFGMEVTAYVRTISGEREKLAKAMNVELTTSIEQLFQESDIVSLHIPLQKETERIIDRSLLSLMKKEAILVNTARGGLINEEDLIEVLENGDIIGAGLDVFTQEPPPKDHPFFRLKQVVATPHIGGISMEAAKKTSVTIARNLVSALDGNDVPTIVNGGSLKRKVHGLSPQ